MQHYDDKVPSYSDITLNNLSELLEGTTISFKQTVDFFWLFLSKFVCATTSKKPTDSVLPQAIILASWCHEENQEECAFSQVILAQLYNILSILAGNRLSSALSFPYQQLDSWVRTYFPDARKIINHAKCRGLKHGVSINEFVEYLIDEDGIHTRETGEKWFCFGRSLRRNSQWDIFRDDSNSFVLGKWHAFITPKELPLVCSMQSQYFIVAKHYMPHFNNRQVGFMQAIPYPFTQRVNQPQEKRASIEAISYILERVKSFEKFPCDLPFDLIQCSRAALEFKGCWKHSGTQILLKIHYQLMKKLRKGELL